MKQVVCVCVFNLTAAPVTVSAGDCYSPPVVELRIQIGLFSAFYVTGHPLLGFVGLLLTGSAAPGILCCILAAQ